MSNMFKAADSVPVVSSVYHISEMQRELVYASFYDTVRNTGVPATYIGCEFITYVDDQKVAQVQIRLIFKKWSGMMLRYSMAFQRQMSTYLDRLEPHIDHTAYEWCWKYSNDCDLPFPSMPAPEEWINRSKTAVASPQSPVLEFFERRKVPRQPKQRILIR